MEKGLARSEGERASLSDQSEVTYFVKEVQAEAGCKGGDSLPGHPCT